MTKAEIKIKVELDDEYIELMNAAADLIPLIKSIANFVNEESTRLKQIDILRTKALTLGLSYNEQQRLKALKK